MSSKKLNSMRVLEQHKIPYEAIPYDAALKDAEQVADAIGEPAHTVFKTLVVENAKAKGKPMLAIIPANTHLDLKKMAAAAGEKKVQMAAHADAEKHTGLQVGGISALALTQKSWRVFLHQSAAEFDHITMSAGQRGTQLKVPTAAFIELVGAELADIAG